MWVGETRVGSGECGGYGLERREGGRSGEYGSSEMGWSGQQAAGSGGGREL